MSKKYITDSELLAFRITSTDLKFTSINTPLLSFREFSTDLKYINKSKVLSFKLNDYDQSIPIYQIILEFIMETGGVF